MSGKGTGRVYRPVNDRGQKSPYWSIAYSIGGKRHYESSKSKRKSDAQRLLRQRIGDHESGKIIGNPQRVVLSEYETDASGTRKVVGGLRALVERQYSLDGRKSVKRVREAFEHLEEFFGEKVRVAEIKPTHLDAYAERRLAAGRARSTVNYELAQLRRGYSLAIKKGLLAVMPPFSLPKIRNARQGYFENDSFAALMAELPPDVGDLVQGLRFLGWRCSEVRLLQWANVDRDGGIVRLEEGRSKSGKPRTFPFGLFPSLKALIEKRHALRDGLYVFHRNGEPVGYGAIRSAWKRATKRAGLEGMLVHDLRRSFARDARRAGLGEGEIMRLAGWETRSMFDRYNIIDEADLARAVSRFSANSETTAKPNATESNPNSVS